MPPAGIIVPMSDSRSEGVEHLQVAARELIAAARSFLDAAEEMVEDRASVERAVDTVVGQAASIASLLTRDAASAADRPRRHSGRPFESDLDDGPDGEAGGDAPDGEAAVGGEAAIGGEPPGGGAAGGDGATGERGAGSPQGGGSRSRSRVRRIDVE